MHQLIPTTSTTTQDLRPVKRVKVSPTTTFPLTGRSISGVGQLDPRDGVRGMICASPDSQVSAAMRTIMELPILVAFARFSVSEYGNFKHWRQPANAHREQVHGMLYVEAHRLTPKWAAV